MEQVEKTNILPRSVFENNQQKRIFTFLIEETDAPNISKIAERVEDALRSPGINRMLISQADEFSWVVLSLFQSFGGKVDSIIVESIRNTTAFRKKLMRQSRKARRRYE